MFEISRTESRRYIIEHYNLYVREKEMERRKKCFDE